MIKQVLTLAALAAFSAGALADNCTAEVHGTKSFAQGYLDGANKKIEELAVPKSCKSFTINLTHSGTAKDSPKTTMGHNIVIAKADDIKGIAKDGVKAGIKNDYIKADDKRIVAKSAMIGGGEKTSVTFDPSKIAATGYDGFCTFPGHEALMRFKIAVK